MQALGLGVWCPVVREAETIRLKCCAEPELGSPCKTEHWEYVAHL